MRPHDSTITGRNGPGAGDIAVPPIPVRVAHRPTLGGLAVPYVTPYTDDGRRLFGGVDPHRQWQCLTQRRCGVCGLPLGRGLVDRLVLLMRLSDLPAQRTSEPALDPVCAAYTEAACPMIAGQLTHYRSTPMRLGTGMAPAADEADDTVIDPRSGQLAAAYTGVRPLRIRPITWRQW